MNPQSNKTSPEDSSAPATEAIVDFFHRVTSAIVTNGEQMVKVAEAFIKHVEQFLLITRLTCLLLRQIFYLCCFNTLLLAWIVIHPLLEKPSLTDSSHDNAVSLPHVEEFKRPIEPNSAP